MLLYGCQVRNAKPFLILPLHHTAESAVHETFRLSPAPIQPMRWGSSQTFHFPKLLFCAFYFTCAPLKERRSFFAAECERS